MISTSQSEWTTCHNTETMKVPLFPWEKSVATHQVNLDALIPREDFETVPASDPTDSDITYTLRVTDLTSDSFLYPTLRKPDFQRETSNWTSQTIAEFVLDLFLK